MCENFEHVGPIEHYSTFFYGNILVDSYNMVVPFMICHLRTLYAARIVFGYARVAENGLRTESSIRLNNTPIYFALRSYTEAPQFYNCAMFGY